ncbi:MAG: helix-turn-helix domain-containing protein [Kiloniellaceae bacterium]
MSEKNTRRVRVDPAKPPKDKTDWARVKAMSDAEVEAAARADPEARPLTKAELREMRRPVDPKAVRLATGLNQEAFAKTFNIPLGTVRDWEQGRSRPDQAAQNYLRVIATEPEAAKRALAAE